MIQAIVFDYDGVLADTEPLHLRAFQAVLAPLGVELSRLEYFERYLGLDDEGVFRTVAEDRTLGWEAARLGELVADKTALFRESLQCQAVLYDGVAARLREWAASIDLAVASGSLRQEIEPVLDAAGLSGIVPVIVGAGETARGKPFPDPYERALELLSARRAARGLTLDPGLCVAVEDSPWGIDSAHAAGLRVVAVTTSYEAPRLAAADAVVRSFADLSLGVMEELLRPPRSPGMGEAEASPHT